MTRRLLWAALLAMSVFGVLSSTAGAVSVSVVGPDEVIYDYSTQRCDILDPPDGTPNAYRDALGRVQIVMSQPYNRRMIGPDIDHLTHDCTVMMGSDLSPFPWEFNDAEWLASTWIKPSGEIYALVHSEYHGSRHPGWCPSGVFIDCRYNTVTLAKSVNNGDTFTQAAPPDHLVASFPYPYWPDSGRYGVFSPSNIVQKGAYLYTLLLIPQGVKRQPAGACLMRTREQDLDDPHSWRAWDGTGFNVRFINPYLESPEPIGRHLCEPVDVDKIGTMNRSLVWNSDLNKWIVVGTAVQHDSALNEDVWGFYFSTSDDLIHWTPTKLMMRIETGQTYICGDQNPRAYPSLIDSNSPSPNYDVIDNSTYLYFGEDERSDNGCLGGNDRNLVRVPIQFSP